MAEIPYLLDLAYTTNYFAQQSPTVLNYVAKFHWAKGCNMQQPFAYCDLGCGNGLTCNTLAAANPNGEFYGIDLNPEHIDNANTLAEKANLPNVRFLTSSFADLASDDLPQFDFIALHGVYSWVSAEVRADVREVLKRFLKPHGLVYVSYNALPGWAPLLPIREIMRTFTKDRGLGPIERAEEGVKILQMLLERKAPYAVSSTKIEREIRRIGRQERRYLAHEFLNKHWQPMFFSQVASELNESGLSYCCRADLREYALHNKRMAKFSDFIESRKDAVQREAARSTVLNERFRRDVYCAEIEREDTRDPISALSSVFIGNARTQRLYKDVNLPGRFKGGSELVERIFDGRKCLSEILSSLAVQGMAAEEVFASIRYLVCEGWMRPFVTESRPVAEGSGPQAIALVHPLNRVLLDEQLLPGNGCWLASTVTGDGVKIDMISGLLLRGALSAGVDGAVGEAVRILAEGNSIPALGGKILFDPEEQEKVLLGGFPEFESKLLPVLERLGIVERLDISQ
jgi:SAM-dependent methyltransferase